MILDKTSVLLKCNNHLNNENSRRKVIEMVSPNFQVELFSLRYCKLQKLSTDHSWTLIWIHKKEKASLQEVLRSYKRNSTRKKTSCPLVCEWLFHCRQKALLILGAVIFACSHQFFNYTDWNKVHSKTHQLKFQLSMTLCDIWQSNFLLLLKFPILMAKKIDIT